MEQRCWARGSVVGAKRFSPAGKKLLLLGCRGQWVGTVQGTLRTAALCETFPTCSQFAGPTPPPKVLKQKGQPVPFGPVCSLRLHLVRAGVQRLLCTVPPSPPSPHAGLLPAPLPMCHRTGSAVP